MKITILAIGKKHDSKIVAAVEDYSKRLAHYTQIEWKLTESKLSPSMNEVQIRNSESRLMLASIGEESTVVLLDETGTQLSSPELADKLQNYMNKATKSVVFVIGGAYGVSDDLKQRADLNWSLSKLVFPHQLVRLILVEQLYRAHTILAGEKYHHI